MSDTIKKTEYDIAKNAIESILSEPIEKIAIQDTIPTADDLADNNQVFRGKLSILFVDMRKSSEITEDVGNKKMVKIYRAFIRLVIQAIRYSGGYSRQFAGDGIMGVFQDSIDEDTDIKTMSSSMAIRAARYIVTLINKCLNPILEKHIKGISIACSIGISTGDILITKTGMKGKEGDNSSENETGIVWVGKTTNNASRYCELANGGEIFVDNQTHSENIYIDDNWKKTTRVKGTKAYKGYLSRDYYLELDEKIETITLKAEMQDDIENTFVQNIFDNMTKESRAITNDLEKKTTEIITKLCELAKREEKIRIDEVNISNKEARLKAKQNEVDKKEIKNYWVEYAQNKEIFSKSFLKENFIKEMEELFWEEQLNQLISIGKKIGKSENVVKGELSYYLVSIYLCFSKYEKAYDALCFQAQYSSWIHASTVEKIINKSKTYSRLETIIQTRLNDSLKLKLVEELKKSLEVIKKYKAPPELPYLK